MFVFFKYVETTNQVYGIQVYFVDVLLFFFWIYLLKQCCLK